MIGGDSEVSRYRILAEVRVTAMLLSAQLGVGVGDGVAVRVGVAVGGPAQESPALRSANTTTTRAKQWRRIVFNPHLLKSGCEDESLIVPNNLM